MSNKKFDEFIQKQSSPPTISEIDWAGQLLEWQQYLSKFYEAITLYLKQYIDEGKIKLTYGEKSIFEEYLGEYKATTATIAFGNNHIKLDPIGTNLIGAKGRVDMIGTNGHVKFVLVNSDASAPKISVRIWIQGEEPPPEEDVPKDIKWEWKIATQPPRIKYFVLNQESFFDALMEVANG